MLKEEAIGLASHYTEKENILNNEDLKTQWIDNYVSVERKYYDDILKDQPEIFTTIPKMRDKLVELCMSEKFQKFIKIAMKCRYIHRRKEYGIDDDDDVYVVPKEYSKLSDIQNQLIENNELILEELD